MFRRDLELTVIKEKIQEFQNFALDEYFSSKYVMQKARKKVSKLKGCTRRRFVFTRSKKKIFFQKKKYFGGVETCILQKIV